MISEKDFVLLVSKGMGCQIQRGNHTITLSESIRGLPGTGFIYLIKCGVYYKIGLSRNLIARLESIKNCIPYDIQLISTMLSFDVEADEKRLHKLFSEYSHRNEWFKIPESVIRNRNSWFTSNVSPYANCQEIVRQSCVDRFSENQTKSIFGIEIPCDTDAVELYKDAMRVIIDIDSNNLAKQTGLSCTQVHDKRYQGLYQMNAKRLREELDVDSNQSLLDVLSDYDLVLNNAANAMVIEADNPELMILVASGIADLHKKATGKVLEPRWDKERLAAAKARRITHSLAYQTELPLQI